MPKKVENAVQKAVDLEFLADEVEAVTKEYLLWVGEIQSRIIPARSYFNLWRRMFQQRKDLNEIMKNYRIIETGVMLGKNYDVIKERHEYLLYLLTRLLSPSVQPETVFDKICGRFVTRKAYMEQEREDLEKFALRLEKIFCIKKFPSVPKNLDFVKRQKEYLRGIQEHFYPLRDMLSEVWHGTLKEGDRLNGYFTKYESSEPLSTFLLLPFTEWFVVEGQKIVLKSMTEEVFLFLLSGLLAREFMSERYAWRFYVSTYFYLSEANKEAGKNSV